MIPHFLYELMQETKSGKKIISKLLGLTKTRAESITVSLAKECQVKQIKSPNKARDIS